MNISRVTTLSLTLAIAAFSLGYVNPSFAGKPDSDGKHDHGGGSGDGGGDGSGTTVEPPPATVPTNIICGGATVDGRVTTGDGYTKFGDLGTGSADYGDVFFACDTSFYYFAMRLNGPSTGGGVANENVYACRGEPGKEKGRLGDCTASDYLTYHADFNTGWGKHTFRDLLKSDRARFQIACNGVVKHDFVQEYLTQVGSGWASGMDEVIAAAPAASASSLAWNLEHPFETGWGDDPGEDPLVQSPPLNPSYPTYDSQYDGWIWEMIYEFKVPKQPYDAGCGSVTFALASFSGATGPVGGIHSSPAKVEGGSSIFIISEDGTLKLVE